MRESEVAAELDYQMRRLGAEGPAFETIVASGERTAWPHADASSKAVEPGEPVLIDMGARQDGYHSDLTRMLALGRPGRRIAAMHRAVLEAQLAALESVREGVAAAAVDRTARQVLRRHGLERRFVHSTGHGLGLEIHEPPRLGAREPRRLRAGMVITIEPGVYIPGLGGVRIEDTVVVTAGGAEILTNSPKELLVI
jgi:Xaa-Pro aminopeptidase